MSKTKVKSYKLSAVVAVARNNAIGVDNKLPWTNQKADMARFVSLTKHNVIVMGRKTFESFGSKPLKDRFHIILTKDENFKVDQEYQSVCVIKHSVKDVLEHLESVSERVKGSTEKEVFVIGGGEIYKEFMPHLDKIYLTEVLVGCENADTFFPHISTDEFDQTSTTVQPADEKNDNEYIFCDYTRIVK